MRSFGAVVPKGRRSPVELRRSTFLNGCLAQTVIMSAIWERGGSASPEFMDQVIALAREGPWVLEALLSEPASERRDTTLLEVGSSFETLVVAALAVKSLEQEAAYELRRLLPQVLEQIEDACVREEAA